MGRPTDLTPAVAEAILHAVGNGALWQDAAAAGGVSASTLRRWRQRGDHDEAEDLDSPYRSFCADLHAREAECLVEMSARIVRAAATDWRAAAWLLERRRPDDYGRRDYLRAEHSGPNGGPIEHEGTTDWRAALAERLERLVVSLPEQV